MRLILSSCRGFRIRPALSPPSSFSRPRTTSIFSVQQVAEYSNHQGHWQRQWKRQSRWEWWGGSHQRPRSAPLILAANSTALGTAAFVELSEDRDAGPGQTGEKRMLEASRAEISKKLDDDDRGFSRLRHGIVLFLDVYIWEPLCTGFRFLHLAVIFVPVLFAVPIIWLGKRQKDHDNERTGALWWYNFLVKGMEWAGPAFIKVRSLGR